MYYLIVIAMITIGSLQGMGQPSQLLKSVVKLDDGVVVTFLKSPSRKAVEVGGFFNVVYFLHKKADGKEVWMRQSQFKPIEDANSSDIELIDRYVKLAAGLRSLNSSDNSVSLLVPGRTNSGSSIDEKN